MWKDRSGNNGGARSSAFANRGKSALRIVHLVDENAPDDLVRGIEWLCADPVLGSHFSHRIVDMRGTLPLYGQSLAGADLYVSHLPLSFRLLPGLIRLRAQTHVPLVHVEHIQSESYVVENIAASRRHICFLRAAYGLFDRVVACSNVQATWMVEQGALCESMLAVIAPRVELGPFRAIAATAGQVRHFGLIGQADRQSGFDQAIDGFRAVSHPWLRLNVFAEGTVSELRALRALAGGDTRIIFRALDDRAAAIAQSDAVIIPARWHVANPAIAEARAAGRPVALAAIEGAVESEAEGCFVIDGPGTTAWAGVIRRIAALPVTVPQRCDDGLGGDKRSRQEWIRLAGDLVADRPGRTPHLIM